MLAALAAAPVARAARVMRGVCHFDAARRALAFRMGSKPPPNLPTGALWCTVRPVPADGTCAAAHVEFDRETGACACAAGYALDVSAAGACVPEGGVPAGKRAPAAGLYARIKGIAQGCTHARLGGTCMYARTGAERAAGSPERRRPPRPLPVRPRPPLHAAETFAPAPNPIFPEDAASEPPPPVPQGAAAVAAADTAAAAAGSAPAAGPSTADASAAPAGKGTRPPPAPPEEALVFPVAYSRKVPPAGGCAAACAPTLPPYGGVAAGSGTAPENLCYVETRVGYTYNIYAGVEKLHGGSLGCLYSDGKCSWVRRPANGYTCACTLKSCTDTKNKAACAASLWGLKACDCDAGCACRVLSGGDWYVGWSKNNSTRCFTAYGAAPVSVSLFRYCLPAAPAPA